VAAAAGGIRAVALRINPATPTYAVSPSASGLRSGEIPHPTRPNLPISPVARRGSPDRFDRGRAEGRSSSFDPGRSRGCVWGSQRLPRLGQALPCGLRALFGQVRMVDQQHLGQLLRLLGCGAPLNELVRGHSDHHRPNPRVGDHSRQLPSRVTPPQRDEEEADHEQCRQNEQEPPADTPSHDADDEQKHDPPAADCSKLRARHSGSVDSVKRPHETFAITFSINRRFDRRRGETRTSARLDALPDEPSSCPCKGRESKDGPHVRTREEIDASSSHSTLPGWRIVLS